MLFEDQFEVTDVDPQGKKFENVSRLACKSSTYEMELIFDVQTELYPMKKREKFNFAIARTLDMSGADDSGVYNQSGEPSLLDKYDYCMHGTVYRYEYVGENRVSIFVSHGGLLMKLTGDVRHFKTIELDKDVYTLLRKIDRTIGA